MVRNRPTMAIFDSTNDRRELSNICRQTKRALLEKRSEPKSCEFGTGGVECSTSDMISNHNDRPLVPTVHLPF
jgi:hypothetical protein